MRLHAALFVLLVFASSGCSGTSRPEALEQQQVPDAVQAEQTSPQSGGPAPSPAVPPLSLSCPPRPGTVAALEYAQFHTCRGAGLEFSQHTYYLGAAWNISGFSLVDRLEPYTFNGPRTYAWSVDASMDGRHWTVLKGFSHDYGNQDPAFDHSWNGAVNGTVARFVRVASDAANPGLPGRVLSSRLQLDAVAKTVQASAPVLSCDEGLLEQAGDDLCRHDSIPQYTFYLGSPRHGAVTATVRVDLVDVLLAQDDCTALAQVELASSSDGAAWKILDAQSIPASGDVTLAGTLPENSLFVRLGTPAPACQGDVYALRHESIALG